MDINTYHVFKQKIALSLSSIVSELFNDKCQDFLHVVATIGITSDAEVCGSIIFNYDNTILKVNAEPSLANTREPCQLPMHVSPASKNGANVQPTVGQDTAFIIKNCPKYPEIVKEECTLTGRTDDQTLGNDPTDNLEADVLPNTVPISRNAAPKVVEISNQIISNGVDVSSQIPEPNVCSDLQIVNRSASDPTVFPPFSVESHKDGVAQAPGLDVISDLSFETRNSLTEPPVLERQEQCDLSEVTPEGGTTDDDRSFYIMSPDCSSDRVLVFDCSQFRPPQIENSPSIIGQITRTSKSSKKMADFLKRRDSSSNVGDTEASFWHIKDSVTNGVKKWKLSEFKELLETSGFELESCEATQPSCSSFFLALAHQLKTLRGHPRQGSSHGELREALAEYMDGLVEDEVESLCEYVEGGSSAWDKYRQIIRRESSLVDHLAVVIASKVFDVRIRLISMVTEGMKLQLKETVLNDRAAYHNVELGEYLPHYYQALQSCSPVNAPSSSRNPMVKLKRLNKTQIPQKRLRLRRMLKNSSPTKKPSQAVHSMPVRKRRQACGRCGPCKIKTDCMQCNNCRNKKVSKNKCRFRKCIRLQPEGQD